MVSRMNHVQMLVSTEDYGTGGSETDTAGALSIHSSLSTRFTKLEGAVRRETIVLTQRCKVCGHINHQAQLLALPTRPHLPAARWAVRSRRVLDATPPGPREGRGVTSATQSDIRPRGLC